MSIVDVGVMEREKGMGTHAVRGRVGRAGRIAWCICETWLEA